VKGYRGGGTPGGSRHDQQIDLFRFNMKYVDGNLELEKGS
jgi:hypothetical protein